jgi:hypothetical protein
MPRTPATVTQSDVARTIRAAKQAGAHSVEVRLSGVTVVILLASPPIAPDSPIDDAFTTWEREYESAKTARRRDRD